MGRRRLIVAFALALAAAGLTGGPAGADPPALDDLDPVRFSYGDAIVERALVASRDGLTTLAVDVIRPPTAQRVPTILLQSPYYNTEGRGYLHERKTPWGEPAFTPEPRTAFPEWYDEYFVPRGYAVVLQDMRGTRNSSGCQVYGGREEAQDAVDVIDWIAARSWSDGSVAMTGGSYDGTVAIAAAALAPEPLKAIIPIRAIDRWYDYHFYNGVQSAQHAATPWTFTTERPLLDRQNSYAEDPLLAVHLAERPACALSIGALVAAGYTAPYQNARSDFWSSRDALADAGAIRAATFIVHGRDDSNVRTTNAAHLWAALPAGVPKKIWWFRGGHDDPRNPALGWDERFVDATHRWFAQFLKGIDTDAAEEPVSVQHDDGVWTSEAAWPTAGPDRTWFLSEDGLTARPGGGAITYRDDAGPFEAALLDAPALGSAARVSGQPFVRLAYSLERGGDTTFAFTLTALLPGGGVREIGRAYARGAYRDEINARGPSWPTEPVPHLPGVVYRIEFPFSPQDVMLPAATILRLRIGASDLRTMGPATGGTVTLHPGPGTALVVPEAG